MFAQGLSSKLVLLARQARLHAPGASNLVFFGCLVNFDIFNKVLKSSEKSDITRNTSVF